jgi:hypothetical protein
VEASCNIFSASDQIIIIFVAWSDELVRLVLHTCVNEAVELWMRPLFLCRVYLRHVICKCTDQLQSWSYCIGLMYGSWCACNVLQRSQLIRINCDQTDPLLVKDAGFVWWSFHRSTARPRATKVLVRADLC